jgi:hypothetical protein
MKFLYQNPLDNCNTNDIDDESINYISELLNLKDTNKDNICDKISTMHTDLKCINDTTLLGEDLTKLHPLFLVYIIENNKIFCGDIRTFVKLDKNPYTGTHFSNAQITDFKEYIEKIKLVINNIDDIPEELNLSLTAIITDVLSELPYANNPDLFLECSRQQIDLFLNELIRYDVIDQADFNSIYYVQDLYTLKLTLATLLKVKIKFFDLYTIAYAYNSIFFQLNDDDDNIIHSIVNNNFEDFKQIDFVNNIENIITQIIVYQRWDFLYFLIHEKNISLHEIYIALDQEEYDLIPSDIYNLITEQGGKIYVYDNTSPDISRDSSRSSFQY